MGDEAEPRYPVDTDHVEWTPERLRDRIAECERLLAETGRSTADPMVGSVRSLGAAELETKREVLVALRERGQSGEASVLGARRLDVDGSQRARVGCFAPRHHVNGSMISVVKCGKFTRKEAPLELERFLECRPKSDRLLTPERPLEE